MTQQVRSSISRVKRDRQRKDDRAKKRMKMRDDLPVLTKEDIRRYRLPLHRALLCELEEEGLTSSAGFLTQLIEYQKWLRKSHGPDSKIWTLPKLIRDGDILSKLAEGFKAAEKAHYAKDVATECDHFLRLGVEFSFGTSDWWWLGQQLLVQAVHICTKYHGDGQRRLASSKYIYGKYLFENDNDVEQAIPTLKEARILSKGHSWTAAKYLHYPQKTVFVESCIVLYRSLLAEAKSIMNQSPKEAILLCAKARRRAYDACDHEGEAKSLLLQGICENIAGKASDAAESFYKVLLMHIKAKRVEETCEARIYLIQAYLKLGNWQESYQHLQQLLQFAESHNIPYYIGQSYRYMGEYYLNHGNPDLATPLLIKAINAFHEIGDINNREQTKNFAAVSAGQELMPKYINFILKCGHGGITGWNYLQKLVRWKDARDIAWSESSSMLHKSTVSLEVALSRTGASGVRLTSILEAADKEVQQQFLLSASRLDRLKEQRKSGSKIEAEAVKTPRSSTVEVDVANTPKTNQIEAADGPGTSQVQIAPPVEHKSPETSQTETKSSQPAQTETVTKSPIPSQTEPNPDEETKQRKSKVSIVSDKHGQEK